MLKRKVDDRLELVDKVGLEPQLYGLLNVYKNYSPDISLPQSARGSKLIFTVCYGLEILSAANRIYYMFI